MDKDAHHILPASTSNMFKYDKNTNKPQLENKLRFQVQAKIREIQKDYEKQVILM